MIDTPITVKLLAMRGQALLVFADGTLETRPDMPFGPEYCETLRDRDGRRVRVYMYPHLANYWGGGFMVWVEGQSPTAKGRPKVKRKAKRRSRP